MGQLPTMVLYCYVSRVSAYYLYLNYAVTLYLTNRRVVRKATFDPVYRIFDIKCVLIPPIQFKRYFQTNYAPWSCLSRGCNKTGRQSGRYTFHAFQYQSKYHSSPKFHTPKNQRGTNPSAATLYLYNRMLFECIQYSKWNQILLFSVLFYQNRNEHERRNGMNFSLL